MGNFPLTAEIGSGVWGTSANFNCMVSRLGSVTARHSSSGRQPNFTALNRGHHLYSAGRPHVGHWPTFLVVYGVLVKCLASGSSWLGAVGGPWVWTPPPQPRSEWLMRYSEIK